MPTAPTCSDKRRPAGMFGSNEAGDLRRWEDWIGLVATGELQESLVPTASSEPQRFCRAVMP